MALAVLGPILLAPSTASATTTAKDPSWFSYSRPARYSAASSLVRVPMRDGQSLSCYLTRPGDGTPGELGGSPVVGRFPGLIVNYFGYAVLTTADTAQVSAASGASPAFFAEEGYNTLNCYVRGLGLSMLSSLGYQYSYASPQENQDDYDLIEWLAAQPFSDGRIGQTGGSYGAQTSERVAGLRPPHLMAIAPISPVASEYLSTAYPGGAYGKADPEWASTDLPALCGCTAGAVLLKEYVEHPTYDSFWRQIDPNYANARVPTLILGGFADTLLTDGGFESYVLQQDLHNYSGDGGPYLVQGDWAHAETPSEGNGFQLAWFDHWLYRMPSAPLPPSRLEVARVPDGTWQNFDHWPPAHSDQRLYLARGATLGRAPGAPATASYVVSPTDNATAGTAAASPRQSVTFTAAPLSDNTEVVGRPIVHLLSSLTAHDGIFAVQFSDVAPDGTVTAATAMPWFLKASHNWSQSNPASLIPGRRYDFKITGWNIDHLFRKDHRIQITIQSGNSNLSEAAPSGEVNIALGNPASYVSLQELR